MAFDVRDAFPFDTSVSEGETLYMQAKVYNASSFEDIATVVFEFDGSEVDRRTQGIASRTEETVQVQVSYSELKSAVGTGTFTLSARVPFQDSFTDGSVTVEPTAPAIDISVSCTDVSPSQIEPGDTMSASGRIRNGGTSYAQVEYRWLIGGRQFGTQGSVTVSPGGSVNVSTNISFDRLQSIVTLDEPHSVEIDVTDTTVV